MTLIIWMLTRKTKRTGIIKVLFYISLILGIYMFFEGILYYPFSLVFLLVFILLKITWPSVWTHNLTLLIALAGISPLLGFFISFQSAVLLFGLLAIYDFVAVFYTRHMVDMFKKMGQQKIFFAFIMPIEKKLLNTNMSQVDFSGKYTFLGTGDVALPLVVLTTAWMQGSQIFLIMVFGVIIGLFFMMGLFFKYRKPMPGLPPLAIGILIAYIITLVI